MLFITGATAIGFIGAFEISGFVPQEKINKAANKNVFLSIESIIITILNLSYFIAKRLVLSEGDKSNVSARIIKIAVIAIVISMVMMLVSVGTGLGLQEKIREKLSAFNGHIIISHFDENESQVSVKPIDKNQDIYINQHKVEGVNHVQAVAVKAGIIRTEKTFEGILFKGIGSDYKKDFFEEYLTKGRFPVLSSEINNEVVLSEYLANRLELKVGDTFNTFFMKENTNKLPNMRVFKLVGIFNSGFQEFDANYVLGDIRHIQKMNKWHANQIGHFEIFIDDFDDLEKMGNQIYEITPSDLNAKTIAEKYISIFEWLKLFDFNILVILLVMTVVATINMVVALLVLILERTQMIGILKSYGTSNKAIRKIFLYHASYLIGKGLLLGNAIGLGLLFLQDYFGIVKLDSSSYYVNVAPVYITFWHILFLNLGTMFVCLFVLLLPSYIISKISPIAALRFN